jgi:hypothetical protein
MPAMKTVSHLGGMLAIWHDVAPGDSQPVREWYAHEHHFERLAIPGFRAVRRFERVAGTGAEVFGAYEVDSPAVLRSAAYRERVEAPTPWTQKAMRSFRNMNRTVCQVTARVGGAEGGHVAVLAAGSGEGVSEAVCRKLLALPGVLQVTALRADATEPRSVSAEQALRGGADARIAWAVLLDADTHYAAEQALQAAQEAAACRRPAQFAVYRLSFAARNPR